MNSESSSLQVEKQGSCVSMPLPQQDEFGEKKVLFDLEKNQVSMPLPQQDEFGEIKNEKDCKYYGCLNAASAAR